MSKTIPVGLPCALLATALAFGTNALGESQTKAPSRSAQSVDSMTAFWEKFKAAVIKGDKETVAALSQFPISMGYGMTDLKNKAQFMRHYRALFFGETNAGKCFPKAKPLVYPATKKRPKEFTIGCGFASEVARGVSSDEEGPFEYRFTMTRNGWRFTGFENVNE
ncbi:MAG: hypothetical protein ABR568_00055 [Pyrinomonadaceae bacterium]